MFSARGIEMKYMRHEDIPQFVQDVVALGCEICALGYVGYTIGDADLSWKQYQAISPALRRISETYGDRSHLKRDIILYLNSIGRYVDMDDDAAVIRRH
jgi:hypothetical protein